MANQISIEDGIISWFDGPEWDEVVLEVFERYQSEVQSSAQANAPWEDITGNARAGLKADVKNEGGVIIMTLAHSVSYGKWLETIQSGRFAIISRTLEEYSGAIMREAALAVAAARRGN